MADKQEVEVFASCPHPVASRQELIESQDSFPITCRPLRISRCNLCGQDDLLGIRPVARKHYRILGNPLFTYVEMSYAFGFQIVGPFLTMRMEKNTYHLTPEEQQIIANYFGFKLEKTPPSNFIALNSISYFGGDLVLKNSVS